MKLYDTGVYVLKGNKIIEDNGEALNRIKAETGKDVTKESASKGTMAYRILTGHNTSGNDSKLKIKFDAMASHDITYVGIVQTARASGLEKFPIP